MCLRKDGTCCIFHVQHQTKGGDWTDSDVGYLMFNPLTWEQKKKDGDRLRALIHPYKTIDDPWQIWGIHGWIAASHAKAVMDECAKHNPTHSFRVVGRVISQTTVISS
jgi:hypothetical protein